MDFVKKDLSRTSELFDFFTQEIKLSDLPYVCEEVKVDIRDRLLCVDCIIDEPTLYPFEKISKPFFIESKLTHKKYRIQPNDINGSSVNIDAQFAQVKSRCKFGIAQFADERWDEAKEYYYRFLIPVDDYFWSTNINTQWYEEHGRNCSSGLIILNFPSGDIHVYPYKIEGRTYMVVESQKKVTFETMHHCLYSISLSLGLVAAVAPFDYSHFVACDDAEFVDNLLYGYTLMRETIKTPYSFINVNMHSIRKCLEMNHVEEYSQLWPDGTFDVHVQDRMQMHEFAALVKMLYENEELARATLILLESSKVSLDIQGAMCSVALETICSSVVKDEDKKYMKKESWKEEVRPIVEKMITDIMKEGLISEELSKNMINKIDSLNDKSNMDFLASPFPKIGYKLSSSEKKVIRRRNVFLHGGITGNSRSEQIQEIIYTSLELQKLCVLLLFRHAGFNGYIVNNAVLFGCKKAIKDGEPVLIK